MRNVSDKSCRENRNILDTKKRFSKIVPFMRRRGRILQSRAGHRRQCGLCALHAGYLRLTKAHSEYVILIALQLQQWFHESASVLHHT